MGVRLPAEYQEVEYLESKNCDIDLEYIPKVSPNLALTFKLITGADADVAGFAVNKEPFFIINPAPHYNRFFNRYGTISPINYGNDYPAVLNVVQRWEFGRIVKLNHQIIYTNEEFDWSTNTQTMHLCRARNTYPDFIIYDCSLYDGDQCVRKLIPCYRKLDNKPGLYDLRSDTFFIDSAEGMLLVGPDIHRTLSSRLMDRRRILIAKLTSLFKNIISSETGLVSFNTNFAKPMKVVCEFSPKQEGTGDPSPENIRPISAWDGANIISTKKSIVSGESVISILKNAKSSQVTLGEDEHGRYAEFTTISGACVDLTPNVKFKPNTQYTIMFDGCGGENAPYAHLQVIYDDSSLQAIRYNEPYATYQTVIYVSLIGKSINHIDICTRSGTNRIYYDTFGIFEGVLTKEDFESYQANTLSIPFNNPGIYDFLPIQEGTGDPSPENVRPITPGLTLTRDDNTTLEVWGGSLTVNADGTGTITSKYYQCVYDGVNKKVNSSYLSDTFINAGDVYCNPNGQWYSRENLFSDKLRPSSPYDTPILYQIISPLAGNLYLTFKVGLTEGSGVTNAAECIAYANNWFQNNPTSVVYKLREADYQTYTLSVAETSRAFEALGLGKNLGPLYGGTVTINEDGSCDVVVDHKISTRSTLSGYPYRGRKSGFITIPEMQSGNGGARGICNILPINTVGGVNDYLDDPVTLQYGWNDNKIILWKIGELVASVTGVETPTKKQVETFLLECGFTFTYPLATPITYHFSSISELQSFLGTNNVWSDLNGPITVEYYKKQQ